MRKRLETDSEEDLLEVAGRVECTGIEDSRVGRLCIATAAVGKSRVFEGF